MASGAPGGHGYRRLALVGGMASLLDSAALVSVGSALPLWRADLGLGSWHVGLLSAALTLSVALGALVGGRVADRRGRRRVFLATVGVYAAGALLVACAQGPASLTVAVVVLGVASGADLPASIALVAERTSSEVRAGMVASTQVMWTAGIVVSTGLAFAVSPLGLAGTRVVFAALAAAALVTLVARRAVAGGSGPVRHPIDAGPSCGGDRSSASAVGSRRALVLIGLFYVVYTLVANTFGSFRTYFLAVEGGASQALATGISFGLTALGLLGTVVFSAIADTPLRQRVYVPAAVFLVASQVVVAAAGASHLSGAVLGMVLYSLAYPYVGEGLYKVWTQEWVAPHQRASLQGMTIALARCGAALFAVVTPTLMAWNASFLFWLLAGLAGAAAVIGRSVPTEPRDGSKSTVG